MFISLDLETTGFHPEKDKIIEFGAVKFDLNGHREEMQFLIDPEMEIPPIVTHITNIHDHDVKGKPKFEEKAQEITEFIGDLPIIGHNIQFDTGFLKAKGIPLTNPEYDTVHLTSILIPGLPSYSLEIISKVLELVHEDQHRALDDAIAAMELFIEVTKRFQQLDPKLISEIKELLQRSSWDPKKVLLNLDPTEKKSHKISKIEPEIETVELPENIFTPDVTGLFETVPPYNDIIHQFTKTAHKDSYISLPFKLFREIESQLPNTVAKIDLPSNYVSQKRLNKFKEQEVFEDHEITALLKFLIWESQTETGHLSEVKLFGQEIQVLNKINIDENIINPEDEHFYRNAVQKDKDAPAVCTHRFIIEKQPKIEDLTIIDLQKFAQSLHYVQSQYLTVNVLLTQLKHLPQNPTTESLQNKATILFGLIGMYFEKHNDNNPYTARAFINENSPTSTEWPQIIDGINSLIETSKELAEINTDENKSGLQNWKKSLQILCNTFKDPQIESNQIWIEENYKQEITIRITPTKTTSSDVLSNIKNFKIISENLSFNDDGGEFIKTLHDLPPDLKLQNIPNLNHQITISIPEEIPDTKNNNKAILSHVTKVIEKEGGNTAIVFNSNKNLKFFTLELSKNLPELNVVSSLVGSTGKTREKFKADPENSILLVTKNAWLKFNEPKLINTLIVHQIPFDPPSDPYITATSQNFQDPFNDFQIPLAALNLKQITNHLPSGQVIITDPRLHTKRYGQPIKQNLLS